MDNYDIDTIRLYINDKEGSVFTDEDIHRVASQAGCIWCAISELWTLRALMVDLDGSSGGMASGGGGYTVGLETYKEASSKDIVGIAKDHAAFFKDKCTCGKGGRNGGFRRMVFNPTIPYIDD